MDTFHLIHTITDSPSLQGRLKELFHRGQRLCRNRNYKANNRIIKVLLFRERPEQTKQTDLSQKYISTNVSTCKLHVQNDNDFIGTIDSTQFQFENTPENFHGGKISNKLSIWQTLTSDHWILDVVRGYKIEFDTFPCQQKLPNPINLNLEESEIIRNEIEKLWMKGVLTNAKPDPENYISNIFIRPKSDGSHRLI